MYQSKYQSGLNIKKIFNQMLQKREIMKLPIDYTENEVGFE